MILLNRKMRESVPMVGANGHLNASGRVRLTRELFCGRYRPGQRIRLRDIAGKYGLDNHAVLKLFTEFQSLGLIALSGNFSAVVQSPDPKEMHEAYEILAGLEEIAGRRAAEALTGNTAELQKELDAMRVAVGAGDLDGYAEHDAKFHKAILLASGNRILLRVWEALAFDLRIRIAIGKVSKDLSEVVEAHQPIVDALRNGRAREASLLLRNHVETFAEYLRKSDSDSGVHRAFRRDLEGAKDVQQAFFPPRSFSIPCLSCETFYQPARGIGGDYYDFLSLSGGRWGIAIGDVSGKGIGAALLMASLQASLRGQVLHPHLDLTTLIGDVNRLVFESSPTAFFASLFYAEYEPASRTLQYVNAGHHPPIIVRPRAESCELFYLRAEAVPVGMFADAQFATTKFQLAQDDILVAYTDGITEAVNISGEQWGLERLEGLLRSSSRMAPSEIVERILAAVSDFAKDEPQRDDVTLVVMKAQSGCENSKA
ncbi:MAG TPA: SpoIIE family protein phosphatase [Candidatus Sulfotelmatobacter sp.]|nr:SpoIIE family protein phosphatase [Candidatus Sulfotelmatobacter sp.]